MKYVLINNIPKIYRSSYSGGNAVLRTITEHVDRNGLSFTYEHYYYEDLNDHSVIVPDFLISINLKNYIEAKEEAKQTA